MRENSAPEIRPVADWAFDASVLPRDACVPGRAALVVASVTMDRDCIPKTCPDTELEPEYRRLLSMGGGQP